MKKWKGCAAGTTGIGCYFDNTFHELLGLIGAEFQDLYHFTVGGPVEDQRLSHLERANPDFNLMVPQDFISPIRSPSLARQATAADKLFRLPDAGPVNGGE